MNTDGVNKQVNGQTGFTLLEMMVVIAVIAILAAIALPNLTPRYARAQVEEVLKYGEDIKPKIKDYYGANTSFPATNADASLPPSDKLINTLIKETTIKDGAIHFTFGNNANAVLKNKVLTLQPLVVTGSPMSPIDWTCGFSKIPNGMEAKGENKTNIDPLYLPIKCNTTKTK